MQLSRRQILAAVAASAAGSAWAQPGQWPERPIQLLIPYPPGGSTDLIARPLSIKLQERLGQPVVLDYKPGAGGTVASQAAARAKPDGHTFIMVLAAHAINASLYPKLPYDTRKDFAPVSLVANLPLLASGSPSLKARSIAELIAEAKANPGKITYGSAGNGNTSHLAVEYFASVAGIKLSHVPYKGSAPMVNAMLAGEVQLSFDSASTSLPHVQSGRLHGLAVTGNTRLPMIANVPTMAQAGLPGFVVNGWYAVLAPAGTPAAIVERMSREIAAVVAQPEIRAQLEAGGYQLVGSTPAALDTHIDAEIERWAKVVKDSGARID
ncbi:tripartite tricarboxylate transporter substrate binding protein [Pseudorhodoferax sp. Leaf267]|uniref:tripartite tricarboxylate transporter substrate binding protein n=1 Tax=Pseudorhodoferax sp. Leaf267 TaxID=1736316 RepID=UPI0007013E6B|nr:tripartite tricarboxylate transporter substrate binding protein [Pseudorhodoferax sp. Leaf267]KQP12521.1 MFS transporter [Pseudorhodoferax sp. Leaf267]